MSISHESVHEWWDGSRIDDSERLEVANSINDNSILEKAYNDLTQEQQDLVLNAYYQKQDYFNPNEEEELGVMSDHGSEDKGWTSYPAGTLSGRPLSRESQANEYWASTIDDNFKSIPNGDWGDYDNEAICNHCGRKFTIDEIGTEGLLEHLENDHGISESKANEFNEWEDNDLIRMHNWRMKENDNPTLFLNEPVANRQELWDREVERYEYVIKLMSTMPPYEKPSKYDFMRGAENDEIAEAVWNMKQALGESIANEDSYYLDDQTQYDGTPYHSQSHYVNYEIQGHFKPSDGSGFDNGNWSVVTCNHCGQTMTYDQAMAHMLNTHDTTTNANQAGYTNFGGGNEENNWTGTFMKSLGESKASERSDHDNSQDHDEDSDFKYHEWEIDEDFPEDIRCGICGASMSKSEYADKKLAGELKANEDYLDDLGYDYAEPTYQQKMDARSVVTKNFSIVQKQTSVPEYGDDEWEYGSWDHFSEDYNMKCDICGRVFDTDADKNGVAEQHLRSEHSIDAFGVSHKQFKESYNPMAFINKQLGIKTKAKEVKIERDDGSIKIDGKDVIKVWETMNGWYHYAIEDNGKYIGVDQNGDDVEAHEWFGYTQGDYDEWGYFDSKEFDRNPMVWEVPKSNWAWTGRESYAKEDVTFADVQQCPECNGTGEWKDVVDFDCPRCNGTGQLQPYIEQLLRTESYAKEGFTVQVKDDDGSVSWQQRYDTKEEAEKVRRKHEKDHGYSVSIIDSDYEGESYAKEDRDALEKEIVEWMTLWNDPEPTATKLKEFLISKGYGESVIDKIFDQHNVIETLGESKASEYGDPLYGTWDQNGWFFGITDLTRDDYEGGVYWKGVKVEHYDHDAFQSEGWEERMRQDAIKLVEKIKRMEADGKEINFNTVIGEAVRGKWNNWKKQDADVRDETLDFADVNADVRADIVDMTLDDVKEKYPEEYEKLIKTGVWGLGESKATEKWNDDEWFAEIEKLASGSGVKRTPVENFLATIDNNDSIVQAEMNFVNDAEVYGWNEATRNAILQGITKYFSHPIWNQADEHVWDNKTFTCSFCGKVGTDFSEMAKEICQENPPIGQNGHQIPLFGDQVKPANEDYIPEPYDKHFEWKASMDQDDYLCKYCGQQMAWDHPQYGRMPLHTAPVDEILKVVKSHLNAHSISESKANEWGVAYPEGSWGDWDSEDQAMMADGLADMEGQIYCKICGKVDSEHRSYYPQSYGNMDYYPDGTKNIDPPIKDHAFVLDEDRLGESKATEDYDYRSDAYPAPDSMDKPYDWWDGQGEFIIDTVKDDLYQVIKDTEYRGWREATVGVIPTNYGEKPAEEWEIVKARQELEREGKIQQGNAQYRWFQTNDGKDLTPHWRDRNPSFYWFDSSLDLDRPSGWESKATEKTGYRKRPTGYGTYVYEEKSKINCQNCGKEIYETDGDTFHTTKCRYCGHVNLTNDLTYESEAKKQGKEVAEKLAYYFNRGEKPIDWTDNQVSNEAEKILQETYGITTKKPEVAKEVAHESHSPTQEKIIDRKLAGVKSDGIVHELMLWENMSEEQATKAVESTEIPVMDSVSFSLFNRKYSELTEVERQEIKLYGGEAKKVNKSREGV